ncbi:TSUP family transporter [Cohnella caldifontis]|uniref:TSUP family transporter n=1 Tax=Cohnella caldifontis TaxID=3027471 RepID=UPI0023EC9A6B|nr:TSUP family transporter [Cohnella sp. YIM B05605]
MDWPSLGIMLFLAAAGFAAAFIDSVAGGGGLIAVPALLMTGMPPDAALGTNKLGGTAAALTSSSAFLASGNVDWRTVRLLFPLSFAGALLGTETVHLLSPEFLRPLVIVMLGVILVYTLFKKKAAASPAGDVHLTRKALRLLVPAAFAIGFYDGFFGPGTGSFLLFAFLLAGYGYVGASGNAKMLNLGSNLSSLLMFLLFGSVQFGSGIILALFMIGGAWTGSRFAIKRGAAWIKPLFAAVTAILIGKQLWDLLIG